MEKYFEEMEKIFEEDPIFEVDKIAKKIGKPIAVTYTISDEGEPKVEVVDFSSEGTMMDRIDRLFAEIERSIEASKKKKQS